MTKYVAVDGRSGSGKTYFSLLLGEALQAPVVHLDDYGDDYRPFIGIPTLKEVLQRQKADIVIYEGVGVFDERLDEFHPFKICIDTPKSTRLQRLRDRDVPNESRSAEEWEKIEAIWHEAENEYFAMMHLHEIHYYTDDSSDVAANGAVQALRAAGY